jgi:galactokinase
MAISLALADVLLGAVGASRIHGGGFAGTTLHFVPSDFIGLFAKEMSNVFGENACHVVAVRQEGVVVVLQ